MGARLLQTDLAPLYRSIIIGWSETQLAWDNSRLHGLRTKYHRRVFHCSLSDEQRLTSKTQPATSDQCTKSWTSWWANRAWPTDKPDKPDLQTFYLRSPESSGQAQRAMFAWL